MEQTTRVLWFCNTPMLAAQQGSGSWLATMAHGLVDSGRVELGIVANGSTEEVVRRDYGAIRQWVVPRPEHLTRGLPSEKIVKQIIALHGEFAPDLVHIWGAELYFGLLVARSHLPTPALLTVQGLKCAIGRVFDGQLSKQEQWRCAGLREVLRRLTIAQQKKTFVAWTPYENEILAGHKWVSCQTPWQAAYAKEARADVTVFPMDLPLREVFSRSQWSGAFDVPVIFCSAGYAIPFKGLHTAIRALAILKPRYATIQLRVAGPAPGKGLRRDGYMHWLAGEIGSAGLGGNVQWLGTLSGEEMAGELQRASVALVPSFVESYSMALAEAMMVGTPAVTSFTGGTSYLGRDGETCLFFPPGDETMCAHQLERILTDHPLAQRLSVQSKQIAMIRNDPDRIVTEQIRIYDTISAAG